MQVRRLLAVILCLFVSVVSAQDSQALRSDDVQAVSGAAVPRLVRFSGAVELSAKSASREAASGSIRTLTFSVFADQNGGAALWSETQNVAVDADGKYSVMIGAATKGGVPVEMFATGAARWLQIEGAGDQPRALMVSVPYALKAEDAEKLAGKSASDFVLSSELQQLITAAMAAAGSQAMREPINSSTAQSVDVNGSITFTDTSIHNAVIITQNGTGNALDAIAVSGHAIRANAPGTAGFATIVGNASGAGGKAISGNSTASSGSGIGVSGTTQSSSGVGVQGSANNVSGGTGVYGIVPSGPGTAILADVFSGSAVAGKFRSTSGSSNVIVGSGPGGDKFTVTADGDVSATSLTLANGGTFSVPDGGIFMGTGSFTAASNSQILDVTNTGGGSGPAIIGTVLSDFGNAVIGLSTSALSTGAGVLGESYSTNGGSGVLGISHATSGQSYGVRGWTSSPEGVGVEGSNYASDPGSDAAGVQGNNYNEDGTGVLGYAIHGTGQNIGVRGLTISDNGIGVLGDTGPSFGPAWGVWGHTNSPTGIAGVFTNNWNAQAIVVFDQASGFKTFGVDGTGDTLLAANDESTDWLTDVPSPGLSLASSIWNGDLSQAVLHKFTWKNDVAFGDGQNFPILSLIYGNDQDGDGEVLSINSDGTINFAPGQSFGDALSSSQPSSINVNNNFGPALHVENTGSNNALSVLNTGTGAGLFVQNNDTTTTATISNNNSAGTALRVRVEPYTYDRLTVRHDGVELPPLDYPFVGTVGFGSNLLDMTAVAVDSGDTNRYQHTFRWQVAQIDGSPTSGELQLSYGQDYTFSNPPALKVAADGALTIGGVDSNVTPIKRHFSATGLSLNLSGITSGSCGDSAAFSMPGTAQGDRVVIAMNNMDVNTGWMVQGFVSPGGDAIVVRACRFQNASGGSISGTFNVDVWR